MIGIVIREHQRFAQNCLAVPVRYFREEIGFWILHQVDHLLQVALERRDAFVPFFFTGGRGGFWPISGGKWRRNVFRISTEFENVPLCEAGVFEQLPAGVGQSVRERSVFPGREIIECVREVDVRASTFQEVHDLLAQFAIGVWRGL
jgi:hypothetical protein